MRFLSRTQATNLLRRRIERASYPRIQMMLMVMLTGASGLLCSFVLLHLGLESMPWRYPMALLGAYLFFLFMLWVWLRFKADDLADAVDMVGNTADQLPDISSFKLGPSVRSGEGGDFGGGGASASFDGPAEAETASLMQTAEDTTSSLSDAGNALDGVADGDELVIPLLVIALLVGLAMASLYVVYTAPALMAEVALDGALSYTLYRKLKKSDQQHWLQTAVRRTVWPFLLTAVFVTLTGYGLHVLAPEARTISEALHRPH